MRLPAAFTTPHRVATLAATDGPRHLRRGAGALPLLAALAMAMTLTACGGGGDDGSTATTGSGSGTGGGTTTATGGTTTTTAPTCNLSAYQAGAVEAPTTAQLAAYAGTYAGDEGSYNASFVFVKSASATLVLAADGGTTYKGTAYPATSVCIDKAEGPYGKLLYVMTAKGHFDVSNKVDATLGQAWGVSPADGTTIFTNGRKP